MKRNEPPQWLDLLRKENGVLLLVLLVACPNLRQVIGL